MHVNRIHNVVVVKIKNVYQVYKPFVSLRQIQILAGGNHTLSQECYICSIVVSKMVYIAAGTIVTKFLSLLCLLHLFCTNIFFNFVNFEQ